MGSPQHGPARSPRSPLLALATNEVAARSQPRTAELLAARLCPSPAKSTAKSAPQPTPVTAEPQAEPPEQSNMPWPTPEPEPAAGEGLLPAFAASTPAAPQPIKPAAGGLAAKPAASELGAAPLPELLADLYERFPPVGLPSKTAPPEVVAAAARRRMAVLLAEAPPPHELSVTALQLHLTWDLGGATMPYSIPELASASTAARATFAVISRWDDTTAVRLVCPQLLGWAAAKSGTAPAHLAASRAAPRALAAPKRADMASATRNFQAAAMVPKAASAAGGGHVSSRSQAARQALVAALSERFPYGNEATWISPAETAKATARRRMALLLAEAPPPHELPAAELDSRLVSCLGGAGQQQETAVALTVKSSRARATFQAVRRADGEFVVRLSCPALLQLAAAMASTEPAPAPLSPAPECDNSSPSPANAAETAPDSSAPTPSCPSFLGSLIAAAFPPADTDPATAFCGCVALLLASAPDHAEALTPILQRLQRLRATRHDAARWGRWLVPSRDGLPAGAATALLRDAGCFEVKGDDAGGVGDVTVALDTRALRQMASRRAVSVFSPAAAAAAATRSVTAAAEAMARQPPTVKAGHVEWPGGKELAVSVDAREALAAAAELAWPGGGPVARLRRCAAQVLGAAELSRLDPPNALTAAYLRMHLGALPAAREAMAELRAGGYRESVWGALADGPEDSANTLIRPLARTGAALLQLNLPALLALLPTPAPQRLPLLPSASAPAPQPPQLPVPVSALDLVCAANAEKLDPSLIPSPFEAAAAAALAASGGVGPGQSSMEDDPRDSRAHAVNAPPASSYGRAQAPAGVQQVPGPDVSRAHLQPACPISAAGLPTMEPRPVAQHPPPRQPAPARQPSPEPHPSITAGFMQPPTKAFAMDTAAYDRLRAELWRRFPASPDRPGLDAAALAQRGMAMLLAQAPPPHELPAAALRSALGGLTLPGGTSLWDLATGDEAARNTFGVGMQKAAAGGAWTVRLACPVLLVLAAHAARREAVPNGAAAAAAAARYAGVAALPVVPPPLRQDQCPPQPLQHPHPQQQQQPFHLPPRPHDHIGAGPALAAPFAPAPAAHGAGPNGHLPRHPQDWQAAYPFHPPHPHAHHPHHHPQPAQPSPDTTGARTARQHFQAALLRRFPPPLTHDRTAPAAAVVAAARRQLALHLAESPPAYALPVAALRRLLAEGEFGSVAGAVPYLAAESPAAQATFSLVWREDGQAVRLTCPEALQWAMVVRGGGQHAVPVPVMQPGALVPPPAFHMPPPHQPPAVHLQPHHPMWPHQPLAPAPQLPLQPPVWPSLPPSAAPPAPLTPPSAVDGPFAHISGLGLAADPLQPYAGISPDLGTGLGSAIADPLQPSSSLGVMPSATSLTPGQYVELAAALLGTAEGAGGLPALLLAQFPFLAAAVDGSCARDDTPAGGSAGAPDEQRIQEPLAPELDRLAALLDDRFTPRGDATAAWSAGELVAAALRRRMALLLTAAPPPHHELPEPELEALLGWELEQALAADPGLRAALLEGGGCGDLMRRGVRGLALEGNAARATFCLGQKADGSWAVRLVCPQLLHWAAVSSASQQPAAADTTMPAPAAVAPHAPMLAPAHAPLPPPVAVRTAALGTGGGGAHAVGCVPVPVPVPVPLPVAANGSVVEAAASAGEKGGPHSSGNAAAAAGAAQHLEPDLPDAAVHVICDPWSAEITAMLQHCHDCQQIGIAVQPPYGGPTEVVSVYAPPSARAAAAVYVLDCVQSAEVYGGGEAGEAALATLLSHVRGLLENEAVAKVAHGCEQLLHLEAACGAAPTQPLLDSRAAVDLACSLLGVAPPPPPLHLHLSGQAPSEPEPPSVVLPRLAAHVAEVRAAVAGTGVGGARPGLLGVLAGAHYAALKGEAEVRGGGWVVRRSGPPEPKRLQAAVRAVRHLPELYAAL